MADLNSLAIFAKVVEARSFSEAARRLKMPISTVSRRVAELEDQLGVRLLERSTRNLRLSDIGAEILAHAERAVELSEALDLAVSNQRSTVAGTLRLSVPPSISDTLLAPLLSAFLASYPLVRVEVLVTERHVDHIAEGIDLAFRIGTLRDSSLVARRILTYRRQLVAAPAYLQRTGPPETPNDLLQHRLLAFARRSGDATWTFVHRNGERQTVSFVPYLTMNDYAGLTPPLLTGAGIGELPPVVQPELLRDGRLVEVMPDWRFPTWDLSVVHLGNRHIPRPVRVFKEFAAQMAPTLFPNLPK
jgi:DNA-binding transcriptional LysR family regulator